MAGRARERTPVLPQSGRVVPMRHGGRPTDAPRDRDAVNGWKVGRLPAFSFLVMFPLLAGVWAGEASDAALGSVRASHSATRGSTNVSLFRARLRRSRAYSVVLRAA